MLDTAAALSIFMVVLSLCNDHQFQAPFFSLKLFSINRQVQFYRASFWWYFQKSSSSSLAKNCSFASHARVQVSQIKHIFFKNAIYLFFYSIGESLLQLPKKKLRLTTKSEEYTVLINLSYVSSLKWSYQINTLNWHYQIVFWMIKKVGIKED